MGGVILKCRPSLFTGVSSLKFEVVLQTVRFKTYLLSLGVSDPVTKSTFGSGAEYYKKLAEELSVVLCTPLKVFS